MKFHEQLISLRKQKGLSQEQLGEQIGVSRQTVSKWETGVTTPELEKLIQLGDFFGLPLDELVGRENPRKEQAPPAGERTVYVPLRFHYEYKSRRTVAGLPLVHINIGQGIYKAKGILAIGTIARGVISLGVASAGIISLGAVSAGLISIGALALGLLLAAGGAALGTVAAGGLAVGILAMGGLAVGVYSLGGCALAAKIAAGGYAHAPIAIGDQGGGGMFFDIHTALPAAVRSAILTRFPGTWKWLADLFSSVV